jgi:hypothetical protein
MPVEFARNTRFNGRRLPLSNLAGGSLVGLAKAGGSWNLVDRQLFFSASHPFRITSAERHRGLPCDGSSGHVVGVRQETSSRRSSPRVSSGRGSLMEQTMRTPLAFVTIAFMTSSALAQAPLNIQAITIGPWAITTTYKGDKFDNCTLTRSAADLGINFVRTQDGLLLLLDSAKWKLERGKAYLVRLAAGSRYVEAKALAESKGVTISLTDHPFNEKLRTANILEVRGEGATLRVPLARSAAALERLDLCFEKNSREAAETNPFVASGRRP